MVTAAERFVYALQANGSPHLQAELKIYLGHSHGSVAFPSLYDGLLYVFDGYMTPPAAVTSRGIDAVTDYYASYLAPWGVTLEPPGSVFMDMARVAQANDQSERAVAYLEHNLSLNPDDAVAHYMAAMTFEELEENDKAIFHYERAMELMPQLATYIRSALEALKNQ